MGVYGLINLDYMNKCICKQGWIQEFLKEVCASNNLFAMPVGVSALMLVFAKSVCHIIPRTFKIKCQDICSCH